MHKALVVPFHILLLIIVLFVATKQLYARSINLTRYEGSSHDTIKTFGITPLIILKNTDHILELKIEEEWFVTDWNRNNSINSHSLFKIKEDFYLNFKNLLNNNAHKHIIIHTDTPLISPFVKEELDYKFIRNRTSSLQKKIKNPQYRTFINRLKNLLWDRENIIFVSGHGDEIVRSYHNKWTQIYLFSSSGQQWKTNVEKQENQLLIHILDEQNKPIQTYTLLNTSKDLYPESHTPQPNTIPTSIYTEEKAKQPRWFSTLFGEHYRYIYATKVKASPESLDAYNDIRPAYNLTDHATSSFIAIDENHKEWNLQPLYKNGKDYIHYTIFKHQQLGNKLNRTAVSGMLEDLYTAHHPYLPIALGQLAKTSTILSVQPTLKYTTTQKTTELTHRQLNNKLVLKTELFNNNPHTLNNIDNAQKIYDTNEVIRLVQNNSQFTVDTQEYLKIRMFDMLVGNWNKNENQWKWAAYPKDNKIVLRPIINNLNFAASKYDGLLLKLLMNIPAIRHMRTFEKDIKSLPLLNREAYPLDLVFARQTTEQDWLQAASFIQKQLTAEKLSEAFAKLPKEVQDQSIQQIKEYITARKEKLDIYASSYYQYLQRIVPIAGTEFKDSFEIQFDGEKTNILLYVNHGNRRELIFEKSYTKNQTKEIWLFGLEGKDQYNTSGINESGIKVRLIGGYDEDTYTTNESKKVRIYDYYSQDNHFNGKEKPTKRLSDDYEVNQYHYSRPKMNFFTGYPNASYNPDDGVMLGFVTNYTVNNFIQSPYTQKHSLGAQIYTASGGWRFTYDGIFKKVVGKWDLDIKGNYTTPLYTQNFFGLSNESYFDRKKQDNDFHRTRISKLSIQPTFSKTTHNQFKYFIGGSFENIKVENTDHRYLQTIFTSENPLFTAQPFASAMIGTSYDNKDDGVFPTFGISYNASIGWTTNLKNTERNFFSATADFAWISRLDPSARFVFANKTAGKWINNDTFEFYQAANIGGNNLLRAYRNERFSGYASLVNSSEIRWNFGYVRNRIAPTEMGILLGYDIGRVFNNQEDSKKWHNSYGAGYWLSIFDKYSAHLNYFIGEDGGRISGGIGMNF